MNYPSINEYKEAILFAEDNFEQLKNLRPVLGDDGSPVITSGNFAVVFKMKDEQTGKLYAVKCFTKEQEGRAEAYREIAKGLENVSSPYILSIRYLDKELFVDTDQTTETEFPVLLMDWVEGKTLDKYLRENLDDKYALEMLAYRFSQLAQWLIPQPFAHGDLKPDNILVRENGSLVLVDYDGMYVPAMKGQKARELGSPDFRHPQRTENDFDEHIDDYSIISLLVSLYAISVPAATMKDIDRAAVKYFIDAAIEEGRISASARKESMEQLLRKLHLIDEKSGLLTMAALLLFGKDVERWNLSVAFRIGRFGYSDADLILQDRIVCPLIMMPDMVIDTLRTKYLVSPIHYEGLRRKEPLEIPEEALREMICNSIVHKNYTGTFTQMRVYGDFITLWNDGTLPANFTVKTLFKRHESRPRNKLIANVFYLAGFIEAWGRGYEKIHDAFKAENLEMPVFEEVRGGFMATVKRERFLSIQKRRDVVNDVVSDVSSLSVVQLSERQREICELIKKNPFISGEQMSVVLSVVPRTIWRDLSAMQKKGVLIREGNTSAGHWVLLIDK